MWRVDLRYRQVSDVASLAKLNNLEELWLDNTQMSDLSSLAELTTLLTLLATRCAERFRLGSTHLDSSAATEPRTGTAVTFEDCGTVIYGMFRRFPDESIASIEARRDGLLLFPRTFQVTRRQRLSNESNCSTIRGRWYCSVR